MFGIDPWVHAAQSHYAMFSERVGTDGLARAILAASPCSPLPDRSFQQLLIGAISQTLNYE